MSILDTQVILYPQAMNHLLRSKTGPVGRDLHKRGMKVLVAAKAQVGVKTGKLKASINIDHGIDIRGQYVKIGSNARYALAHHEGTRPHVITPNRAQVLRFSSRGRIVYARAVMHPGTKPNKYLTDNLRLIR